jgi:hypothetical protein
MSKADLRVEFAGRIVFVGFGSIGQGVLPLILRHVGISADRITIVTAEDKGRGEAEHYGVRFVKAALTRENHRQTLEPLLGAGDFLLNLSVDVSSIALIRLAQERGALYLDTCIEPWAGGYVDRSLPVEARTNYAMRSRRWRCAQRAGADRGADPRRESRPGLAPGQAGAAQHRRRYRCRSRGAAEPRGMGGARADARHQGDPHRGARYAGGERAEKARRIRQHLVGGRIRERGRPAGRTRLGHPRAPFSRRRRTPQQGFGVRDLSEAPGCEHARAARGRRWPDASTGF